MKTRHGAVGVVREMAAALPGCFNAHADALVPGLLVALGDKPVKHLQLKLEALALVRLLVAQSPVGGGGGFGRHLDALLVPVKDASRDQYFKVVAESLRVCAAMVACAGPERAPFATLVFGVVKPQLLALDIDQAVKEAAINAAALVAATLGDKLADLGEVQSRGRRSCRRSSRFFFLAGAGATQRPSGQRDHARSGRGSCGRGGRGPRAPGRGAG